MARISIDIARKHAIFHLATKGKNIFRQNPELLKISQASEFFDPVYLETDDPPLYVFDVLDGSLTIGKILISGSTFLGSTLVSMTSHQTSLKITERHELCDILRDALGAFVSNIPDSAIYNIAYSYPKHGVGFKDSAGKWTIVDWNSKAVILPDNQSERTVQGTLVWSFWDEFPQAGPMEANWQKENDFIDGLIGSQIFSVDTLEKDILSLSAEATARKPITKTKFLPVDIRGQITPVHCAPASLAMIFEYIYQKALDQNEVGTAMNMLPMGTSISGQVQGFRHYFEHDFDVELDQTPTWEELELLIEAGLPAKSGIRGHARVATGVRTEIYMDPIDGTVNYEDKLILINDPEPVGAGSQAWENIKTSMLRDFIFIKRKQVA